MAYGLMPSQAAFCSDAKQMYINGHFCYADKFAILTNGLGIVRDIVFLDDNFKAAHPELHPSLAMRYCGVTREKGRSGRIKWCCPKVHMVDGKWVCDCENPCCTAQKGRTTYTYENMELRMFPGIQRDTPEWDSLYKIRTSVERAINHFKINMCIAGKRTRNHATTKADVFLVGIASQLTVIVAHRMNCPDYIRSLKPLFA